MIFRWVSSYLPFSRSTQKMMLDISIKSFFYSLAIPLQRRRFRRDKQTQWWTEGRRMQPPVAWWWSDACKDSRWEVFGNMMSMLKARPKKDDRDCVNVNVRKSKPISFLTLWHFSELVSHAKVTSTNFSALSSSWNMSVKLLKEINTNQLNFVKHSKFEFNALLIIVPS